jgi:hypothetical protein
MKNKLLLCFLFLSTPLWATHLRCGYISVERISTTNRTCRVTITVFTDAGSFVFLGGSQDVLSFGDGSSVLVPETPNSPRPDLGVNVGMASYSILHTYSASGNYTINYVEPNRNEGIINMFNSVYTPFYAETTFDLASGFFRTPEFLVDPFFTAQLGSDFSLSVGAYSQEEDFIIQYELTAPNPQINYTLPENFNINPFNGLITWDTKFQDQYIAGEYLFAVKVHLYKVVDESIYRVSTMIRDFQIVLTDDGVGGKISDNQELDENNRIYIPENENAQLKIFYESSAPIELIAYSELLENEDAFSFTTYDSSSNENIKVGVLTLTNLPSIVRDSPYPITVRGKNGDLANDLSYLFYTKDIYPLVITGIDEALISVELFPNPVKDFVTISLPESINGHYRIFDQSGRIISSNFVTGKISVDMRSCPAGFYYVRIQSGRSFKFIKFIKT